MQGTRCQGRNTSTCNESDHGGVEIRKTTAGDQYTKTTAGEYELQPQLSLQISQRLHQHRTVGKPQTTSESTKLLKGIPQQIEMCGIRIGYAISIYSYYIEDRLLSLS